MLHLSIFFHFFQFFLIDSTEGDMKKGSLGLPLIPPIHKSRTPSVGSAAGSLLSSLQLDDEESQEMR